MRPQWGTISEYVGAAMTLAALIWAYLNARGERARADRRIEEEREFTREALQQGREAIDLDRTRWLDELDRRERAQADLVSVVELDPYTDPNGASFKRFVLVNHSAAAILDLRAFVMFQGVPTRTPSEEQHVRHLSPADSITLDLRLPSDNAMIVAPDRCGVTFRDNAGNYWARFAAGELIRLRGYHAEALQAATLKD